MDQDERRAKMEEKQGHTPTKQHCCNNQLVKMGKKWDICQPNNTAEIMNIINTAKKWSHF